MSALRNVVLTARSSALRPEWWGARPLSEYSQLLEHWVMLLLEPLSRIKAMRNVEGTIAS